MKSKFASTKIACYTGLVVQAIINNFLPILFIVFQTDYGIGYERLANLILVNFVVQMAVDIASPAIINRIGYRATAVICQFAAAAGLLLLSVLPYLLHNIYIALLISITVYAAGSGLMEVILSPMVEKLPSGNKESDMSLLHSFYCWGQAFTIIGTTLLVKLFGFGRWNSVPLIWAIIPLINGFAFFKVPIIPPDAEERSATLPELLCNKRFVGYMVMMLCAGASEISMADWASLFAQKSLGVSKITGDIAGPCAFAVLMALGRIFYAAFAKYINFGKFLAFLGGFSLVCYLLVALCRNSTVSLIACALSGFGVSAFWPGLYSAGAADFPKGKLIMFSTFALCGDCGCCLGPWILGFVAERTGLNAGFAAAAVFPALMIVTSIIVFRKTKREEKL